MPNVMAAQPNIGGALCESSVIPFVVPRRKVWLTPAAGVPCSNAANIGERKTWTQSKFCTWQNSVSGKSPRKCIYSVPAQETAKHRHCSNERKTRNPLKFAGVPQTPEPISAVSGPKFVIVRRHVGEMLLLNKFFRLSINVLVAKIQPDKVVRWCPGGEFLATVCVLYF